MPIYYSPLRKAKSAIQRNAGKNDRVRVPASSITPVVISSRDSWVSALIFDYIHIFIALIVGLYSNVRGIRTSSDKNNRVLYTPAGASHVFPFTKPALAIVFKGADAHLPVHMKNELAELGFTSRPGKKDNKSVTLYTIPTYNDDILAILQKYEDKIDPTYDHTSHDHITYFHTGPLETITDQLSNFALVLHNLFRDPKSGSDASITMTSEKWTSCLQDAHKDGVHVPAPPKAKPTGKVGESAVMDTDEQEGWKQYMAPFGYVRLALDPSLHSSDISPAYGSIADCPYTSGLAAPFVRDYSTRDSNGLNDIITRYPRAFIRLSHGPVKKQISDLTRAWRDTISNTEVGQEMAHVLKTLEICRMARTRAFFVFNTVGRYQGAVFDGTFMTVIMDDEQITGASDEQFVVEKQLIDRHAVAVSKICDIAKVTFGGKITTLRQLSALVGGKNIGGEDKNLISELLAEVDFVETPVVLSPPGLEVLYGLILSDKTVPHSYFLKREDFFVNHTVDKVRSALSIFGDNTPTFQTGTTPRPVIRAVGTAKTPYTPGAPMVLQADRTRDARTAEAQWKQIIATRIINGEWERRKEKTKVFERDEKTQVWNGLENFLLECHRREKGEVSDEVADGLKRGGENSSEETLGGKGKKTKLTAEDEEILDMF